MKAFSSEFKIILILLSFLIFAIEGCSSYASYLRKSCFYGKIEEIKDKEIIINVGFKDRVRIGEIADVYKTIKAAPGFTRRYKKITVGIVEIVEFVNEEQIKAKILYGSIDKDCSVDL